MQLKLGMGYKMTTKQCEFPIGKEDFLKLPQGDQNALMYACLKDIQEKIDWKWKKLLAIGAAAGFVGGLCHNVAAKILGIPNL